MHTVGIDEFREAVDTLELLSLSSREDIKRNYQRLSKLHHPDRGGSTEEFQKLSSAYKIVMQYIDSFRYVLDDEEFKRQNPMLISLFDSGGVIGARG
jgi:DnaJ-class molecular chaperone